MKLKKPNFNRMKKVSKKEALAIDVDQVEKDWENYEEMLNGVGDEGQEV